MAEQKQQQMEEEALTPTRRALYRSASWSVHSNPPPPPPSNLNPHPNPNPNPNPNPKSCSSRPTRRALPPLKPLRRPCVTLTSWSEEEGGLLRTSRANECSRIADHIYLGSDAVARDREALRRHGITHVLNCVGLPRCPDYFPGELTYKTFHLHDSPAEDITSVLYDAFDFLELVRSSKGQARALVHCSKGASRSPALVIAYLMWSRSHSFADALAHVRSARSVADPNLGFASQLLQCQRRVHALPPSPGSLLRVYRIAPHSPYDPLYLVPKPLDRPFPSKLDSRGAFLVVHVNCRIFIWLGRFCEDLMAASARSAADQIIRYENMKVNVFTVRQGSETADFWNALTGDDDQPHPPPGDRKVELYDLDFGIFKRALKGSAAAGSTTAAAPGGWSRVRKKFMVGGVDRIPEEDEEEVAEEFRSPNSLSGDSSLTSGDSASTLSTFSPASSSSLDCWQNASPSESDLHVARMPPPPVLISTFFPLRSRKVKNDEEDDSSTLSTSALPSLAERRGSNPPSLVLSPPAEDGESQLSPRDIVRDWCLSPLVISDVGERRAAMYIEQPTSSGRKDDGDDDVEKMFNVGYGNDCIGLNPSILFGWPDMEKVEEISPRVLDSKSVFMLAAPDSSPSEARAKTSVLFVWVGRCSQLSKNSNRTEMGDETAEDRQIDLDRIRADLIDRMALPLDVPMQIIREGEETAEFLNHLLSRHQEKKSSYS